LFSVWLVAALSGKAAVRRLSTAVTDPSEPPSKVNATLLALWAIKVACIVNPD
jgi:hypothetical protein